MIPLGTYILRGINQEGTPLTFPLLSNSAVVGRQGDVLLRHASVSRHHALLERRGDDWLLTDTGSRNGTFANGASVQRHFVRPGDVLQFGHVKLKVEVVGAASPGGGDEAETNAATMTMTDASVLLGPTTALVGRSEALKSAMRLAVRAAKSDATVLVFGESGTGKELFARLIYEESLRRDRKFIAVNCSAIEQTLLGSTLFGHEKGAFTGADRQKKGLFEEANGGTIFLDEIGELSHDMQVKLLRVLQEGEFMRVGGTETVKVDVRVITATNRDLAQAVKEGKFREDLYYRLNVIQIHLPPLRERAGDVADLVRHYTSLIGGPTRGVSPAAMEALVAYPWPGNVRQLRNVMERTLVLSPNDVLELSDFPEEIQAMRLAAGSSRNPSAQADCPSVHGDDSTPSDDLLEMERRHIQAVLEACCGNKKLAAERLGISRSTLYEKLKECPTSGQTSSQTHATCSNTGHAGMPMRTGTDFA